MAEALITNVVGMRTLCVKALRKRYYSNRGSPTLIGPLAAALITNVVGMRALCVKALQKSL